MLKTFPKHRLYEDAFFTERNFGFIEISDIHIPPLPLIESTHNPNIINDNYNSTILKFGVRDITNEHYTLSYDINISHSHNNSNRKPYIKSFEFTEFPSYPVLGHSILILFLCLLLALIRIALSQYRISKETIMRKHSKVI